MFWLVRELFELDHSNSFFLIIILNDLLNQVGSCLLPPLAGIPDASKVQQSPARFAPHSAAAVQPCFCTCVAAGIDPLPHCLSSCPMPSLQIMTSMQLLCLDRQASSTSPQKVPQLWYMTTCSISVLLRQTCTCYQQPKRWCVIWICHWELDEIRSIQL